MLFGPETLYMNNLEITDTNIEFDISDRVKDKFHIDLPTIDKYSYEHPDMFGFQYELFQRKRDKLIKVTFEYLGYEWDWLLKNRERVRVIQLQGAGIDEYYVDAKHLFDIITVSDMDYIQCTARFYDEVKIYD